MRYEVEGGRWVIEVSELGDARYEFLVAVHELVEWFLLWLRAFDEWWEEARKGNVQCDEPGDDMIAW